MININFRREDNIDKWLIERGATSRVLFMAKARPMKAGDSGTLILERAFEFSCTDAGDYIKKFLGSNGYHERITFKMQSGRQHDCTYNAENWGNFFTTDDAVQIPDWHKPGALPEWAHLSLIALSLGPAFAINPEGTTTIASYELEASLAIPAEWRKLII